MSIVEYLYVVPARVKRARMAGHRSGLEIAADTFATDCL